MQFAHNVFPESTSVDVDGSLSIDGVTVVDVVNKYSTPVIIYSEKDLVNATDQFVEVFDRVLYASKAAPITGIERIIFARGAGCAVASAGELEVALRAGCDPSKIVMHGNNKSDEDIARALSVHLSRLVVEDEHECDRVEKIAHELGVSEVEVQLRITPGIEADTHAYLMTGGLDSKFGSAIHGGAAGRVCDRIISSDILVLKGLHCHIGTQITDTEPLTRAARVIVDFYVGLQKKYAAQDIDLFVNEISVGGGFGIHYQPDDDVPMPVDLAKAVRATVHEVCDQNGIQDLEVWAEPGRGIVGRAGFTAYRVGSIKEIPGVKTYIAVDGGMGDNIRPAMYDAQHLSWVNGRNGDAGTHDVAIAGKLCESGDILSRKVELPVDVAVDDILCMASTGAYSFAMASNYNLLTRPAVVLVGQNVEGGMCEVVRRETMDEMLSRIV
ncbi:MAG TPA: diaminopimelate decarboxylase [Acidimicrobiia bacterium]|nr:diaminopimelate decarboxylase [Acidimicrobiia bacterium]